MSGANVGEIELKSGFIMLEIPEESVELTVTAKVYRDGGIQTVERKLGMMEIREGMQEAESIYIPPDAVFELTETGKKWLDEHREEMEKLWDMD